ncbi:outer membrane lipoprotein-sorting protein [Pseudoalteromonas ostreae]|uniref:outer membrane lipoprotein-sorting protein n=1 Tax=Pseudoalteromonas ostreae TaxID=2774154 RepID=UPI001B35CAB7|nr:outer membrane lipoprotein-sorting protein [Pseudoalteromonas ostreae]
MFKSMLSKLLVVVLLISGQAYSAQSNDVAAQEKGLRIAKKAKKLDSGWGDSQSEVEMILRNKHDQESRRAIRSKSLELKDEGDKSLIIFDEPLDVKGTAFLNFSNPIEPDDQWLYLPALKRIKRISSRNKSGPFMGSEFSYEDMSSFEVEKYTYKYLRDETAEGRECFVLEYYPVDKYSGYPRQVVWLDKEMYQPIKTEYYDRKDSLLKTLKVTDYKRYQGKFWRPDKLEMTNHLNGKSTVLLMANYRFSTGLDERDFSQNTLKRLR